jgi:acetyl-CoA synthetase
MQDLTAAMQSAIKRDLNPLFKIHEVLLVNSLPRTASNKVMRRELRDQYTACR